MAILGEEREGNRKVVLTKWMLVIFSVGTVGYLFLVQLINLEMLTFLDSMAGAWSRF